MKILNDFNQIDSIFENTFSHPISKISKKSNEKTNNFSSFLGEKYGVLNDTVQKAEKGIFGMLSNPNASDIDESKVMMDLRAAEAQLKTMSAVTEKFISSMNELLHLQN